MKKIILVLLVLTICGLAFGKDSIYSFTLRDTSGNAYCNIAYVRNYTTSPGVTPKTLVGGWYYNAQCDGKYYPGGGFKFAVSPYYQYGSGAVLALNSPAYFTYTGYGAWQLLVNVTYKTWTAYWSTDYYGNYLVNYGTWINGSAPEVKGAKDAAQR